VPEYTIFVIEDEDDIRELVEYNLAREGYKVHGFTTGEEALERLDSLRPDLVLLDLMLPGSDGIEICRQLQAHPTGRAVPIIMVTAKGEESDVVLGLGVGADDYVTKPFNVRELVARVHAVLRRGVARREETERIEVDGVVVDVDRHSVDIDGESVPFTATEFRLLRFLASRPGRVFARDQLLDRVIGHDAVVTDRNIDVHIRAVRKKLGQHRDLIETVRGVGYRFRDQL